LPWIGSAPAQTTQRTDGTRTGSETWSEAKAAAVKVRAADHDVHDEDLNDMINLCLKKDGGNQPTAAIPFNDQRLTGLGTPTARTDAMRLDKVQDNSTVFVAAAGTGDAITLDLTPSITAYILGGVYWFKATATNTGATTVNIDGVGAKSIKKGADGATALAAGDITSGGMYGLSYDGTNMQLFNPKFPAGFATTDSPQFSTIELGAASDTTLSRASAGVVAVEGTALLRANQNLSDVAVAATAFTNIKQAASDTATGVLEIADQSEMETGTSTTLAVTPGRQGFHPAHPKMWGRVTVSGGTPTLAASHNITSITDTGTGNLSVTIATDFSSVNWAPGVCPEYDNGELDSLSAIRNASIAAGTVGFLTWQTGQGASPTLTDPLSWSFWGFGDQA
jgi:hypothetical protein